MAEMAADNAEMAADNAEMAADNAEMAADNIAKGGADVYNACFAQSFLPCPDAGNGTRRHSFAEGARVTAAPTV